MTRRLVMTLLLLVILFGGGLLLTSSSLLSRPLISYPFIPVGTVTTWLMLLALPLLGRMLLHGADQPYLEEKEKHAKHAKQAGNVADETGSSVDAPHPLWRLANGIDILGLVLAFLWPFVSYVLAGNWSFSFASIEISSLRFGIFTAYSIFTFILGLLSLIGSFRSR